MVSGKPAEEGPIAAHERRLPPVTALAVATMVLVLSGGVYVAAYLPQEAPLGLPIALLVGAVALLLTNIVARSRVRDLAWGTFFLVGGWALLAYIVIAGLLEYVFILDRTPANLLVLLTVTLVVYAVDIPLLFAFSVARYQPAGPTPDR